MKGSYADWVTLGESLSGPAMTAWREPRKFTAQPSSHGPQADRLEAVSRPALLSALTAAAGSKVARQKFLTEVPSAIEFGFGDSKGQGWWPTVTQSPQAIPEAASLALSMWVGGNAMWSALSRDQQLHLITWFTDCAVASASRQNNWILFGLVISTFLESVGEDSRITARVKVKALALAEKWYSGRGWYSDGPGRTFDYYNAYAFHFYLPMVSILGDITGLRQTYADRLEKHIRDLSWMLDSRGAPILFGRSLTYRFGICAPLSVAPLLGVAVDGLNLRQFTTSCVDYFLSRGIVNPEGIVGRGWHAQDCVTAERYSGPLSSYWFAKTFVNLLAAPNSAYWEDESSSMERSGVAHLAGPNFLVDRRVEESLAVMINHGSYDRTSIDLELQQDAPQYSRFEYSSVTSMTPTGVYLSCGLTVSSGDRFYSRARLLSTMNHSNLTSSKWTLRASNRRGGESATTDFFGRVLRKPLKVRGLRWLSALSGPRIRATSGYIEGWAIHVVQIARLPSSDAVVRFTGWPVNAPGVEPDRASEICRQVFSSDGYVSEVVPLYGYAKSGIHAFYERTTLAEFPVSPYVEGAYDHQALFVVATRLAKQSSERISVSAEVSGDHKQVLVMSGVGTALCLPIPAL